MIDFVLMKLHGWFGSWFSALRGAGSDASIQ